MECCSIGHGLGFRTFVPQDGGDPWFTDEKVAYLVEHIEKQYLDCAITLSVGEGGYDTYKRWSGASVDRYLLRHETVGPCHYTSLYPPQMSSEYRKECLHNLKATDYQTGCGIMAGSPCQTTAHIAEDLELMRGLQPKMVGIGPFVPHHGTPFRDRPVGTLRQTLLLLAVVRLILPGVLLPTTMALGTIEPDGRKQGVMVGTNMVMSDLSPMEMRKRCVLYDNRISTGIEAAVNTKELKRRVVSVRYKVVTDQGNHKKIEGVPALKAS